jgi:hypothetical protein
LIYASSKRFVFLYESIVIRASVIHSRRNWRVFRRLYVKAYSCTFSSRDTINSFKDILNNRLFMLESNKTRISSPYWFHLLIPADLLLHIDPKIILNTWEGIVFKNKNITRCFWQPIQLSFQSVRERSVQLRTFHKRPKICPSSIRIFDGVIALFKAYVY